MTDMIQGYNQAQLAIINKGVDPQYISRRDKGSKTYQYVEASYIVELLNKLFGYTWNWELIGDPVIKTTGGKDKSGLDKSFVTVKGRLSVPVLNPDGNPKYIWIVKESYGSHLFAGTDPEVQGYSYKSAATDALKKCASMLGIAKNVYMSEDLFAYLQEENYADDWTDQTIAMYKDQYDEMMRLAKERDTLTQDIHRFCEETGDYSELNRITPSNVIHFLEWIKTQEVPPSIEEELSELEIEHQSAPAKRVIPKLY